MEHPWSGVGGFAHCFWSPAQRALVSSGPSSYLADAQELEQRRDSLWRSQRNLPVFQQQLEKENVALAQAEQQRALLIGLLASQDKVQTFLALLN